jgi:hypothetical protein
MASKLRNAISPWIHALIVSPLLATAALFVIYIPLGFMLPPGGYFSGDQGVKYAQIDALAHSQTLSVGNTGEALSVFRPTFDSFYRQIGSDYQAIFSPAYAVVVLPFYLLLGMRGLVIPAVFGTLLAALGSGLVGKILGIRYPGAVVFVVGLASPLVFYAFVLWEHALAVGIVVMATYLYLKSQAKVAGILVALAVWLRPETMIFGPALVIATITVLGLRASMGSIVRYAIGFCVGLIPWWTYNFLRFGTFLGPQVEQNPINVESRLGVIAWHLLPLGQRKWVLLLGLVLILLTILYLSHRSRIPALLLLMFGVVGINLLHLGLYSNGVAPSVTDVFPFAFASLISLIWLDKDIQLKLLWVLTGSYLFGVVLITPTWGGGGWGPRMLLGVFPLFSVLAWKGLEMAEGRLVELACLALLVSSAFIQIAGYRHLSNIQNQWDLLNSELTSLEPGTVATAVWWLPQVGTPTRAKVRWYGVIENRDVEELVSLEECIWWIWASEQTSDWWEHPLHHVPTLPSTDMTQVEVKRLSTRGLEAIKYCSTH